MLQYGVVYAAPLLVVAMTGLRDWRRWVGVALLVLPSLLSPTTPDGKSVSIAAHLGGLAAGLALGAALSEAARRDDPLS